MEQAINLFTRGLQMDTNPMVLGNDSMTDCLNGTLITMNSNEVILQNDMGNRRVEDAFLPSGYLPVGMKEYGGIIYVAAYNPITNRSQIGSFPSPERKMKLNSNSIKTLYSCDGLFSEYFVENTSKEGMYFLKSDSVLIPLTLLKNNENNKEELYLHPGDKFVVYVDDNSSFKDSISNFDNIKCVEITEQEYNDIENINLKKKEEYNGEWKYYKLTDKVESPKNKQYTLSLGILNSQNEFVDITPQLERWNTEEEIINRIPPVNLEGKSDLYKFNYGYFIPKCSEDLTEGLSEDDTNFRENRNAQPANTYSYKLIGPLYLKVLLNHITLFDYNLFADREGNNATITIEAVITYNCPDIINNDTIDAKDIDYYTFDLGDGKWSDDSVNNYDNFGFHFLTKNNENYENKKCKKIVINTKYNKDTNLYIATLEKTYNLDIKNVSSIEYCIGVIGQNLQINNKSEQRCEEKTYYIEELSQYGTLDPSKFNTGSIEIKEWRFFNNVEKQTTELTYLLEAYPKRGLSLGSLKMELYPYEINSSNKIQTSENIAYSIILQENITSGRHTILLDWDNSNKQIKYNKETDSIINYNLKGIDFKKLYNVKLKLIIGELDKLTYQETGWLVDENPMASITINKQDGICCHNNPTDPRGCYPIIDGMLFRIKTFDEITQEDKHYFLCKQNGEYYENDNINNILDEKIINESLWLLTTPLLNDCYYFNSSEYAPHYCLIKDFSQEETRKKYFYKSVDDLMTINPFKFLKITEKGTLKIGNKGSLIYFEEDGELKYVTKDGNKQSLDSDPIYKQEYTYNGSIHTNKIIPELYPDCILLNNFDFKLSNQTYDIDDNVIIEIDDNQKEYTCKYSDSITCLESDLYKNDIIINNLFSTFGSILNKLTNYNSQFQVGISSLGESGSRDEHSFCVRNEQRRSDDDPQVWIEIDHDSKNGDVLYRFSDYKLEIFSFINIYHIFNFGFGKVDILSDSDTLSFEKAAYLFYNRTPKSAKIDENPDNNIYSRLWWKTFYGEYALWENLVKIDYNNINDDNELKTSLKTALLEFENLVYCTEYNKKINEDEKIKIMNVMKSKISKKHDFYVDLLLESNDDYLCIYPENIFYKGNNDEYLHRTPTFKSSLEFFDEIYNFDHAVIENLFIKYDNDKIKYIHYSDLNPSTVYLIDDNNLLYITNDFKINSLFKLGNEINAPLYSGNITNVKKYPYDSVPYSHGDQRTSIYYSNVYVIPLNSNYLNKRPLYNNTKTYTYTNNSGGNSSSGSGNNSGNSGGYDYGGGGRPDQPDIVPDDRENGNDIESLLLP